MQIESAQLIGAVQPRETAAAPTATPGSGDAFEQLLGKAQQNLRAMAEKLVASAFVMPMLEKMRDDPFKSDLFHGGFGEDVFQQQLDTRIADEIAAAGGISVVDTLSDHFNTWLKHNPRSVESAARIRIDTLG